MVLQLGRAYITSLELSLAPEAHTTNATKKPAADGAAAEDTAAAAAASAAPETEEARLASALGTTVGDESLYDILGVGHLGFNASQQQLKRAYHKKILQHHPDKKADGSGGESDPMFLKVQKAYDTLSDEAKRRGYDSQFAFDDATPAGGESPEEFFAIYAPVFKRNARFSEKKPVPELGSPEDDDEAVRKFYAFWYSFETWREFSAKDEHNPEDADSREERRWMQQENERARAKAKKKEYKRITSLVDNAHRIDPRVARMNAAAREEKERKKREREAARQAKLAEEQAKKEAEAAAAAERAAAERAAQQDAKVQRQRAKKARRKCRQALVKRCASSSDAASPSEDDVLWLCERAELPALEALRDGGDVGAVAAAVAKARAAHKAAQAKKKQEAAAARQKQAAEEERKRAAANVPWTVKELSFLAKAIKKFPGGTRQRWKHVADYVATAAVGHNRTPKQCIAQAQKASATGSSDTDAFERFNTAKNVKQDRATAAEADAEGWTKKQQNSLERALAKFPASMPKKERWVSISRAVDGKSLKECIARVKSIRAKVLAARAAAAGGK